MYKPSGGLIRPFSTELGIFARLADGLVVIFSLYLSVLAYLPAWNKIYTIAAISGVLLFYIFSKIINLYRSMRLLSFARLINLVILTWLSVIVSLLLLGYMFKITHEYSRVVLGLWFVSTPMLLLGWRAVFKAMLRYMRARGSNTRAVLIVGTNETAQDLAENLLGMAWTGYILKGFIDENAESSSNKADIMGLPIVGDFKQLISMANRKEIDVVYIALPLSQEYVISALMDKLSDTTVSVFLVPGITLFKMMQNEWVMVGNTPAISIVDNPLVGIGSWLKRAEDLVISIIAIVVSFVPMVVITILIKLTSPGPVLYKQKRYGLMGEEMVVWKFRTMRDSEDNVQFRQTTRDDDRVTSIGKILRRTSLDEIPQFFNVLMGDMSIVGPRPHAVAHNEEFRGTIWGYMMRHIVKPGMTGWAQIHGYRGETETREKMEQRIKYDLEYINSWSIWLDLKIIAITPIVLLKAHNAY